MSHKEQKQMLIDAIEKERLNSVHEKSMAQSNETHYVCIGEVNAYDKCLELIEGIL